jgi:hypothetical protein
MYKYSKKAEEKFFARPVLALLFIYFALATDGIEYTKQKLAKTNEKQKTKPESGHKAQMSIRIMHEINSMAHDAMKYITDMDPLTNDDLALNPSFKGKVISYLNGIFEEAKMKKNGMKDKHHNIPV